MLALAGLTFGELDRYARAVDAVADVADQVLVARRLEDVVVLDDERVRREVRVVLGRRFFERLAEQEELELAREVEREARGRGPLDLPLQDAAGRHLDRRARVLVEQIAQHERGLLEPRDRRGWSRDRVGAAMSP